MDTCPWCGKEPDIDISPLWNGSHGYYDCYGVSVACKNPDCKIKPSTSSYNTIYGNAIASATKDAISDWNTRQPNALPHTSHAK